jgi:hypothetical protein
MNFTDQQYLVIKSLADGILPPTETTPAASALPVADMFVSIAKTWEINIFIATANALDVINSISLSFFTTPIQNLDAAQLELMTNVVATNTDLELFWTPFRLLIALNYYALPPAYEAIGMPGPTIDAGGLTTDGYPV